MLAHVNSATDMFAMPGLVANQVSNLEPHQKMNVNKVIPA